MNAKDIRKYVLINRTINLKPINAEIVSGLSELAQIDFNVAFEVWEFLLNFYTKEAADLNTSINIERKVFEMFVSQSETKTRQLAIDSAPLLRLIYGSCATAVSGKNLDFAASLILTGKLEAADVVLTAIRSNPTGDFGERMRLIVDCVFKTYCESKGVKKCELSRKQSTLLLTHIEKIKGPNKMLLTQRIKEL